MYAPLGGPFNELSSPLPKGQVLSHAHCSIQWSNCSIHWSNEAERRAESGEQRPSAWPGQIFWQARVACVQIKIGKLNRSFSFNSSAIITAARQSLQACKGARTVVLYVVPVATMNLGCDVYYLLAHGGRVQAPLCSIVAAGRDAALAA
jgi:hypothetical protein